MTSAHNEHNNTTLLTSSPPITMAKWIDSSIGIHSFLTFDSKTTPENIQHFANKIDYVWGSTEHNVQHWRQSSNPDVVLSYYMPFSRDPTPHPTGTPPTSLPWWVDNYPELVLYQCDGITPAWECFAGEGCSHVSVPLDLTNPETLKYQMNNGVIPAAKAGYNAIALDNYALNNEWSACGSYKGINHSWVQLYDQINPKKDPQYTLDVLNWTSRACAAIHQIGLLVIPNYSVMRLNEQTLQVVNVTDGILAEGGFVSWNPIPNTSSYDTLPPLTNPIKFQEQILFVRHLQRANKGFFAIQEWGPGVDYNLNPSCQPHNLTRTVKQFVAAAYMMSNGNCSGTFLTCIQCYGGGCGGVGNFSVWDPEWNAKVGVPLGEPQMNNDNGVWSRNYSTGLALVNPNNTHDFVFVLPTLKSITVTKSIGQGKNDGDDEVDIWRDVYGKEVGENVTLIAATGMVLLHG